MTFVTLKTFDNSIFAHILKAHLEDQGIEAHIFDEHIVTVNPLYSNAVGGIKVKVLEEDFDEANRILAELENEPYKNDLEEVLECPICKSQSLHANFKSMKSPSGILSGIASFLFGTYPIYYQSVYRCKECNHEFNPKK